ncbi:MAG: tetratricopeptide repeat protein [Myxococcota bacterium]
MSVILNALKHRQTPAQQKQGYTWSTAHRPSRGFPAKILVVGLSAFALASGLGAVWMLASKRPVVIKTAVAPTPQVKPIERNFEQEASQAFERADYKTSIELFKQALIKSPEDATLLNNLGLAFVKNGQLPEAESSFFKAVASDSGCSSCYNNLGDLEMRRGSLDDAELYYQKATKSDPNYADPHFNLGVLYEKMVDTESAIGSYETFLALSKDRKSPIVRQVRNRLKKLQTEQG